MMRITKEKVDKEERKISLAVNNKEANRGAIVKANSKEASTKEEEIKETIKA